ncbi:Alg9-like mannosyltransferase family-domain-containing protein [Zychaea mexicana]|uniref:Alg9-like mannosyltransferase family-domain-containing protein n=1 Tax=Zychaea mexicana TaxID=64656 RepID=UPI0022FE9C27|nr:Alg9-like mannosyltransferase family-domain-containing protein [Zychaea mexicana]KAI9496535.1 Alg9-like mannosyltransferase family-domain-containing protein [Zychaea mexicana]
MLVLISSYSDILSSGRRFVGAVFPFLLGGTIVAAGCILADSLFYQTLHITLAEKSIETFVDVMDVISDPGKWSRVRISGTVVLTPLNNILYNAKVENLKDHGLHPRYLHLLVNFPLLYGPLSTSALVSLLWRPRTSPLLYYVLVSVIILAMTGLSIMPHQEARFLTPMMVPLVLVYTWNRVKINRVFWFLWLASNVATTFIFGVLHQGGLVPAMIFLQQQSLGMEGCHVLENSGLGCAFGEIGNPDRPNVKVQDFGGQFDSLYEALQERAGIPFVPHSPHMNFAPSKQVAGEYERTLVVAPSMAMLPKLDDGRYLLLASFTPHVNFDDIPVLMDLLIQGKFSRALMSLNIYMVLTEEN